MARLQVKGSGLLKDNPFAMLWRRGLAATDTLDPVDTFEHVAIRFG